MEPLQPGDPQSLGSYRILGRLGAGGMGRVYLARSPGGRTVAVKVVRSDLAEDHDFRSRFRQEVEIARAVSGRYTAPVVDADTEAALPWLATQYVTGPSLSDVLDRHGPLPEKTVRALGAGLSAALLDIHAVDLIHRDLKPSNVLMAADGPRVIDFGIARAVEGNRMTQTGVVVGSPGFMSPEQAMGRQVSQAGDIFSLGAVLAFAATGRSAFGEGAPATMLYQVVHEEPDLTGVPASLAALISACLAKRPEARPTPEAIVRDLEPNGLDDAFADWLPGGVASTIATHASRLLDLDTPPDGSPAQPPQAPQGFGPPSAFPHSQPGLATQPSTAPTPPGGSTPVGPPFGMPPMQPLASPPMQLPGPYMPGQPSPGRNGKSTTAIAVVLSLVAVLVLGGGGAAAYYVIKKRSANASADAKPADALKMLWEKEIPDSELHVSEDHSLRTFWADHRHPIYGDENGIRAYDAESGKEVWTVEKPEGTSKPCAMSRYPNSDEIGAAVFDIGGGDCSYLVAFDTGNGETLWKKNLKGQRKTSKPKVDVADDFVLAHIGDTYAAFAVSGGKKLWSVAARGRDCDTEAAQSSDYGVLTSDCTGISPKYHMTIRDLFLAKDRMFSGEKRQVVQVVSDRPLTLLMIGRGADMNDPSNYYLQTVTDSGKLNKSFQLKGDLANLRFDSRIVYGLSDEEVLISAYGDSDGTAATDLKTGKILWHKEGAVALGSTLDGVIAIRRSPTTRDPQLVSIGLRDGKEEVRGTLYTPKHSLTALSTMSYAFDGYKFYVVGKNLNDDRTMIRAFETNVR
ncbi:protein kinase domain-containing protein [Streptomyces gobiensis]|uniref:protein kinase domain-containing protein n=1 Tax=Streptomyces gobiensis TaxID=2875706 RepID=UPI001E6116EE|nr:protein kinase [Streptomyces gobiensis]UGY93924.1 protein kinase [Streptomyces gobiensis]